MLTVVEKIVESKDGEEGCKGDENDNKEVHLKDESEIIDKGKRIAAVDKGKAILIQESEEEEEQEEERAGDDDGDNDEYEDYDCDSSNDSNSDFSDGLGSNSEDDLAN